MALRCRATSRPRLSDIESPAVAPRAGGRCASARIASAAGRRPSRRNVAAPVSHSAARWGRGPRTSLQCSESAIPSPCDASTDPEGGHGGGASVVKTLAPRTTRQTSRRCCMPGIITSPCWGSKRHHRRESCPGSLAARRLVKSRRSDQLDYTDLRLLLPCLSLLRMPRQDLLPDVPPGSVS